VAAALAAAALRRPEPLEARAEAAQTTAAEAAEAASGQAPMEEREETVALVFAV
jgi:hypothetical protein